jgi:hypothetical protein
MDSGNSKVGLYESILTDSLNHELEALDVDKVTVNTKKFIPRKLVID